jgi:hypothetical protein
MHWQLATMKRFGLFHGQKQYWLAKFPGKVETTLFAPSSITYHASVGDKNQLQVLPAGQEIFE